MVDTHTSDRKKEKITDPDTTKGNYLHKLLTNIEIPEIIQRVIMPVNQITADGVATSGRGFYEVGAVLHNEIVTGAMRSSAGVLKDPLVENWRDKGKTIPVDRNNV